MLESHHIHDLLFPALYAIAILFIELCSETVGNIKTDV